jgi:hypothetical protein
LGFSNDVTYDLISSEINVRRQIGQNVAGMVQDIPGRFGELAYTGAKVGRNTAQIASKTFKRVQGLFVPTVPAGTIFIAAASADVDVDLIGIPRGRGGRKNRKSKKNKKTKTNKNKKNRKTNKRRRTRRAY